MNLCIYHGGQCLDGFVSSWVVSQFFPQAEFVGCNYGDAPPNVSGLDVVIVDFSWPRATLLEMKKKAKSLVVLDHHQTAKAELEGLDFCVFDMEKSGARLAWEFFGDGKSKSPWLVDYAEDGDLWRWALPNSREIKAALMSMPWTFDKFNEILPFKIDALVEQGAAIERYREQLIDAAVRNADEIEMAGHKVLCTNVSSSSLISDVGHRLAIDRPFGVTWFKKGDKTIYSLRSTPAGLDVSEIAKKYGGGGHRNAAGFNVNDGPQWIVDGMKDSEIVEIKEPSGLVRHDLVNDEATGLMRLNFSATIKTKDEDGKEKTEYVPVAIKSLDLDRGTAMMLAKNLKAKAEGL